MKRILLLLLLLGCGSYTFAQSFEFLNDGVPVADNSTVNFGNLSGLTTSPIMISKTGSETITATLTITVSSDSYGGIIGYCGWGYESCIPVNPGESISSDKTVATNEAIDPSIEAMPQGIMGAGFLFKTEYKLTYNGKEQKITAIFSSEPLAIISPNETSVVSIVKEDGRMVCKYDFTSTATRQLQIYDLLGKLVATLPLDPNTGQIVLPKTPQGIYIYTLTENGKTIHSNKYIVR